MTNAEAHGGLCSFGSNTESENSSYSAGKTTQEGDGAEGQRGLPATSVQWVIGEEKKMA